MESPESLSDEQLIELLHENVEGPLEIELVSFWGRHPDAELPQETIAYAVQCSMLEANRALVNMARAGLVQSRVANHRVLYHLSANHAIRRLAIEVASLGWERRREVIERVGERKAWHRVRRPVIRR